MRVSLPKDVLLLILQKKEGLLLAVSFRSSWTKRGRALQGRLHGPHTCPGLPKLFPPPRGPTLLALPKHFPGRCPRATPQPGQGHAQRPPSTRPAAPPVMLTVCAFSWAFAAFPVVCGQRTWRGRSPGGQGQATQKLALRFAVT